MPHRHQTGVFAGYRRFGGGKGGGGGEGAGEDAYDHGDKAVLGLDGAAVADPLAQIDASHGDQTSAEDDHQTQQDVGLEILLEIAEKLGGGDVAHRGHE